MPSLVGRLSSIVKRKPWPVSLLRAVRAVARKGRMANNMNRGPVWRNPQRHYSHGGGWDPFECYYTESCYAIALADNYGKKPIAAEQVTELGNLVV